MVLDPGYSHLGIRRRWHSERNMLKGKKREMKQCLEKESKNIKVLHREKEEKCKMLA